MSACSRLLRRSGRWPALLLLTSVLTACSLFPQQREPVTEVDPVSGIEVQHGQFQFALPSGVYRCEGGLQLHLRRVQDQAARQHIALDWQGRQYTLWRDPSSSGLPRFEDHGNGLVWIDLPWKGLLLNARTQAPIASECQAG